MRLAYLYSRYPVLSQTFCDTEMLELERRGFPLLIGSVHSPLTSIRHSHSAKLRAPIRYAPPQPILRVWEEKARRNGKWPAVLVEAHERKYGPQVKAATRARNALFFAELFTRERIDRFHVHFANRAAHTAIFVKALSGIPFSVTAHGQDFMADLGNDDLLREICAAAEFVAVETDYSRELLARQCPEAAGKIHRVYNGMELANFAPPLSPAEDGKDLRIISIGRLVPFKGFNYLIDACADLKLRGVAFSCEIIGDGPLRESLQAQIAERGLDRQVTLAGALSQPEIRDRLRGCDVFALASVIDDAGASDVFPTVILEAMASAKPVLSSKLAGIPESVVDGETGFLVAPRDSAALANALEKLAREPETRRRFGAAGRRRIEEHFQVAATVKPLLELLERTPSKPAPSLPENLAGNPVGYILDRWPDQTLPQIESELRILRERNVPVTLFVCEYDSSIRLTPAMKELAQEFIFLPDEMVIEAEWQANRAWARQLEDDRANAAHRAPAALFLREARYAVVLRRLLVDEAIVHVHATTARALLCATFLQAMTGVTISATVEADTGVPPEVVDDALGRCVGGRLPKIKRAAQPKDRFLLDPFRADAITGKLSKLTRISLTGGDRVWQEWADLLLRWSRTAAAPNA